MKQANKYDVFKTQNFDPDLIKRFLEFKKQFKATENDFKNSSSMIGTWVPDKY